MSPEQERFSRLLKPLRKSFSQSQYAKGRREWRFLDSLRRVLSEATAEFVTEAVEFSFMSRRAGSFGLRAILNRPSAVERSVPKGLLPFNWFTIRTGCFTP